MDHSRRSRLQTTFLIPNLHCPTCVTRIESLLSELDPAPLSVNISIITHSVTVEHSKVVRASSIANALSDAGYEVFDVVLDDASDEESSPLYTKSGDLRSAVARWDPKQPEVAMVALEKHQQNCQMCAAHRSPEDNPILETVITIPPLGTTGDYVAIFTIEGMTCSSCVGNVRRSLEQVPSVSLAEVVLVNHSATVHFTSDNPNHDTGRLARAVEDAGFGAELVQLNPQLRVPNSSTQDVTGDRWEVTYSIEGMSCSSCVDKVTSAINQLPFVERTVINLVQHSGTIVFDGKENASMVKKAIDSNGYRATETSLKTLAQSRGRKCSRTISLLIKGMHCPRCPQRILSAMQGLPVHISRKPSLQDPVLSLSYVPNAPYFGIRSIIRTVSTVDGAFTVSICKPPSIEERSRRILVKKKRAILTKVLLSVIIAIPTLIIGVVYMSLIPHSDSAAQYLMTSLHGVSRAEWATFILATPVYFFATDYFHRRTIKEIYVMWSPRSTVPILKRFYRFGSMNMLISLGTTIAYFSSLAELIIQATAPEGSLGGSKQSYFDSVVFLTMFLLVGRYAEATMKAKSGDAIAALGNLRPTEAILLTAGQETEDTTIQHVDVDLVDVGDVLRIPHGSSPPCDGTLIESSAELDESSLTGESVIVRKQSGDTLFSGTINKGPAVSIRVTGHAGASMLDSIIQVVREGQAKRAPVERVADVLTAYFVPFVVCVAIMTWFTWLALGVSGTLPKRYLDNDIGGWPFWSLQFAIAVFVIACPCGLGLAAPTALFVGGGMAAKRGILVRGGGEAFQEASDLDCIVFDKTGTLTQGSEPRIVQHKLYTDPPMQQEQVLGVLKAVEENSSHPLAKAAIAFAATRSLVKVEVGSTNEIAGKGLQSSFSIPTSLHSTRYEALVGNESLMQDHAVQLSDDGHELLECWKNEGNSVLILAVREDISEKASWHVLGIFAAADPLRPEAHHVVSSLKARKVDVWMLSGDNQQTAIAVARKVGIPSCNVIAGVLPAQKAEKVKQLQRSLTKRQLRGWPNDMIKKRTRATVAMVGDGINDAPALAAADVGIAVASGSDVAMQAASFILMKSDLRAILSLVTLSRAVFRRVIVNFFWAAIYNLVALPVAAGILYPVHTHSGARIRLDPAWAALAMSLSSISVVGCSLLLRTRMPLFGFRQT